MHTTQSPSMHNALHYILLYYTCYRLPTPIYRTNIHAPDLPQNSGSVLHMCERARVCVCVCVCVCMVCTRLNHNNSRS